MLASMSAAAPVSGRLDALSLGAILVTLVFWASAFTGIRVGLEHFTPGPLALYRFLVASVTLLIYMSVTRLPVPERRDLWHIGVLSVAGISLYHVLLNSGQQSVPAGTASLIIAAGPVITALLASRFSGEKLNALGWLGTAVSLGGVAPDRARAGPERGLYPGGAAGARRRLFHQCVLRVSKRGAGAGGVAALHRLEPDSGHRAHAGLFARLGHRAAGRAPPSAHLALLYLGVFPSALAYMTWTFAIARVGASVTSSFLYVSPVLAILMAWALLGEVPGAVTLLGGAVALAGVLLVNTRGRPQ